VKFNKEIQERSVACLAKHSAAALGERIAWMRFPRRGDHAPSECAGIKGQLRTTLDFRIVEGKEIARKRMFRAWPKPFALAAIVAGLIFEGGVAQRRQAVGGDELSLA